jgi:hypothetical protein
MANGPIPDGMWVCHTCDTPPCVRPLHLFLGTNRDNSQDALAKGRLNPMLRDGSLGRLGQAALRTDPSLLRRGERHPNAKLTEQAVQAIRSASAAGATRAELARRFAVSEPLIFAIAKRRVWRHLA